MSVVDMLNKKHKVMNCVFEILYDLYGEPVWLNKPKDGQEPEKIIEQWIKELGDYSETQLKQACYNLFKYKKVATFPKLAHILAELSDIRLNKCKYTLPIYRAAFYYTISDLLKIKIGEREYTELEYSYRNDGIQLRGIQYRKAVELGLFDNFDETLDKIAKERGHG